MLFFLTLSPFNSTSLSRKASQIFLQEQGIQYIAKVASFWLRKQQLQGVVTLVIAWLFLSEALDFQWFKGQIAAMCSWSASFFFFFVVQRSPWSLDQLPKRALIASSWFSFANASTWDYPLSLEVCPSLNCSCPRLPHQLSFPTRATTVQGLGMKLTPDSA